ncbi:MerR family DNA-binding protein [Paraglaciecola sp.]|uniref:MerR family DNA-binding protein n=1 Tax=Paraglaciecola sp. TaxID=1920173 RepID=UPI0030F48B22
MFYNAHQQQRLAFILTARTLGFSIKDMTNIFYETDQNNQACSLVRDIIENRLADVEQQFLKTQALIKVMKQAIGKWQQVIKTKE